MLSIANILILSIGAVFLIFWLVVYVRGYKHAELFDSLSENDYPLKEIYFVGYELLNMLHYSYKSKKDRKLRKEIELLYGEKYADYYLRVIHSQKSTWGFSLLVLSFAFYGMANDIMAFGIMVMFSWVAFYYFGTVTEKKILSRSEEMMREFSEVISKLALLTNAGMIFREAWTEVAYTGESALYEEMQRAVDEMNNGYADVDAMSRFGNRCVAPEIKKFTSTIVQGMIKGNSELTIMLQQQSKEVWNMKRQLIRREGEKASSKLMMPIMIMFVGILVMVLIPVFTNMGM